MLDLGEQNSSALYDDFQLADGPRRRAEFPAYCSYRAL